VIAVVAELTREDWHRLNGLLARALELDGLERARWLRELPAAEIDLLPLLERLLRDAAQSGASDFALPASLLGSLEEGLDHPKAPGECIGPYRLIRPLGRGGMATVWLADRVDGRIERQVALKVPNAEWTDRGLADRLRRECSVLASLNHPNVAQLYDAGWSGSGLPYLAMEVVDGQPIDRFCIEHKLDVRARVQLFVEVLRAVAYAHARLVVHRDLKPANVLVTGEGRVKLLDFGIAKVLTNDETAAAESELTRSGGRPITPGYAAPEQLLGRAVTTATDIYALGIMLFELLSGERPFRQRPETRSAVEEAMARGDPPTPSSRANPSITRALRGDLDVIVCKALQKDPEQRFETAAAFADDLERYLDGRAVRARRGSTGYRLRRFITRNRLALGAGGAVSAAVLVGLMAALWQAKRAEVQAQSAAAIGNFVLSVIQQADPDASQQTKESDLALLRTVEERITKELANRPDLRFSLRVAVATSYRNRGEVDQAAKVLRTALHDAEQARGITQLDLLRAEVLLGEVSTDDKERAHMLDPAIPVLRHLGKPAAPVLVDALLARTQSTAVRDRAADADLREALEVARAQLGLNDEHTLRAATALAANLGPDTQNRDEEAAAVLEPVLRAVRAASTIPASNPELLRAQSLYGNILCTVERCDEGIPLLEKALRVAIDRHHDGQEVREALRLLGQAQLGDDQQDASIATFASIYTLLARREPFSSRLRSDTAFQLCRALMVARRPLESEPFVDEMQAYQRSLPADAEALAGLVAMRAAYCRAGLLTQLGQYQAARQVGEALLRRSQEEKQPYYEWVANGALSDIYLAVGDLEQAGNAAQASLDFVRRTAGPNDEVRVYLAAVSRVKLAQGDPAQALAITDEGLKQHSAADPRDPDVADYNLARGRALLALGRAADAREPLALARTFWARYAPDTQSARIATYWFAKSLLVNGEAESAPRFNTPAQPPLDFPPPDLPLLRAERSKSAEQRIAAVLQKYPLRPEIAALIAQDDRSTNKK
jgi:eukaryotic-like serine/threonine-protein kinase